MSAGSSFTNFVTEGNVRQNAQDFNPLLYSKVGAITGYPGPNTGIAAAAGNPGPKIVPVMNGGRKTAPGPDYHSFVDSDDLRAGVYGRNLAPVKSCNNNMCGGKKSKTDNCSSRRVPNHKSCTRTTPCGHMKRMRSSDKRSRSLEPRSGFVLPTTSQIELEDNAARDGLMCSIQISTVKTGLQKKISCFLKCMKSLDHDGLISQRCRSSRGEPFPR